jgi:hypothetical protein
MHTSGRVHVRLIGSGYPLAHQCCHPVLVVAEIGLSRSSIAPRSSSWTRGKSKVLQEDVEAADIAELDEAINCCPTEAIPLADDV